VEWELFRRADGGWKSAEEVTELAERMLGGMRRDSGEVQTFYCQSGVRTTQLIFGLALAGWPLSELMNYDGSWVEWSHAAEAGDIMVGA